MGEACQMRTVFERGNLGFVCAWADVVDVHIVVFACCDTLMASVVERGRGDAGAFGDVLRKDFGWFEG